MKLSLEEALNDINVFLDENGYETVEEDEFDELNHYEKGTVTIAPHGYYEKFVLYIERDSFAKTQFEFITNELKKFRDEREWEQFHNPKDLSIALSIESNELLEQFLWKPHEQANEDKIKEELADVFSFAILLAEKYDFDIEEIILSKIQKNAIKYPTDKAKGNARKYNEL